MRTDAIGGTAVLAALALVAPSPAPAGAEPTTQAGGGAAYEAGAAKNGGAAYGSNVPVPAKRPVASKLTVSPKALVAGDVLPRLRFRVRQRGVERVRARIVVVRLPHNALVARISLGWVKTGERVTARWPAGVALRAGRYVVRLHAQDSRGRTLKRDAGRPGRAKILVHGVKAPPAPPAIGLPPAVSPGGPGVFPVAGAFNLGGTGSRFGSGRTGHIHQGHDIAAAAGTPVVAPYGGTVSSTSYQAGGAGEYVVLDGADGRDYFFAHCIRGSTAVAERVVVAAGAQLCRVGATGTASGPHLHFEIWNVGWRIAGGYPIDPLPELRAWAPR